MEILAVLFFTCLPILLAVGLDAGQKRRAYREIEAYGQKNLWIIHDIARHTSGRLPVYKVAYQTSSREAFLAEVIVGVKTLYWSDPKPLTNLPTRTLLPSRPQWKIELDRLNDPDAFERRNAIKELVFLGEDNPLVAQTLTHVANNDEDPYIRQTAGRALSQLP